MIERANRLGRTLEVARGILLELRSASWHTTRCAATAHDTPESTIGPNVDTGIFDYRRDSSIAGRKRRRACPSTKVAGTDADMRKIPMETLNAILARLGIGAAQRGMLGRWDKIRVVQERLTHVGHQPRFRDLKRYMRANGKAAVDGAPSPARNCVSWAKYEAVCRRVYETQRDVLTGGSLAGATKRSHTETSKSSDRSSSDAEEARELKVLRRATALHKKILSQGATTPKPTGVRDLSIARPRKAIKRTTHTIDRNGKETVTIRFLLVW